jgi:hypothetical protein
MKHYIIAILLIIFISCKENKHEGKFYVFDSAWNKHWSLDSNTIVVSTDSGYTDTINVADTAGFTLPPNSYVEISNWHRSEVKPCPLDTVRGILYWHSKDDYNYGNVWDTGYCVRICGPIAIMGQPYFVPGILKITQGQKEDGDKDWKFVESEFDNGQFYDRQWKKINSKDVYGMIPIYK